MIVSKETLYELFQIGQITFEKYLKAQDSPSEVINRIKKAIRKYETDRK